MFNEKYQKKIIYMCSAIAILASSQSFANKRTYFYGEDSSLGARGFVSKTEQLLQAMEERKEHMKKAVTRINQGTNLGIDTATDLILGDRVDRNTRTSIKRFFKDLISDFLYCFGIS